MITKCREQRLAVHPAEQPTENPTHSGMAGSQNVACHFNKALNNDTKTIDNRTISDYIYNYF